jgi:alkanesulfonate monooxygenase SsuD/methylene tetrahydromethanopterin reductase-like flavin-dependent oxidoreductase (luciferase family)
MRLMRIGLSLPAMLDGVDRATVLDWSRRIEGDGYSTIGFGERIAYRNLELFSTLSAAAAVTERVDLAATVVVLPMHSEVWVAKQAATLDVLSGGRAVLGVGVGGRREDYDALGRPFDRRFARIDAQVRRIRSLWDGEPPSPDLDPVGPPPLHRIPILSGALGPKSLARSAGWADGVAGFELDPTPEGLAASAERVRAAWTAAGRSEPPVLMTSWWFSLAPGAVERLRDYARHYLGVFGADVADAMAQMCTAAGPDAVRAGVEAAREAGFDEIQLVPTTTDLAELDALTELLADLL